MAEDIYGPSVSHLQGKTVHHKIQHVELIMVPSVPKDILDKYKKFNLCCDLMNTNGIEYPNTIYWNIMFATESIIKNEK